MKEIPLTKGFVAMVDDEDYELLSQVKWHWSTGYARTRSDTARFRHAFPALAGPGKVLMHRIVMSASPDQEVDHRSLNRTDNQRHNLRVAVGGGNAQNSGPKGGTSRFKGVSWMSDRSQWASRIRVNRKSIHLGCFDSEVTAAEKHDRAAHTHHGEFARFNFPDNPQRFESI